MTKFLLFLILFSNYSFGNSVSNSNKVSKILKQNSETKFTNLKRLIKTNPEIFNDQRILNQIERNFIYYMPEDDKEIYEITKILYKLNVPKLQIGSIHYIFSAYYALHHNSKNALIHAKKSKLFFKKHKNKKGEIKATFSIGVFYCNMSRYSLSNTVFINLLQNKDLEKIDKGNIHFNIGVNYYNSHFFPEAITHLKKALLFLPKEEHIRVKIILGGIYTETKNFNELKKIVNALSSLKMTKFDYSNFLELKATLENNNKNYSGALRDINESIRLTESMSNDYYLPSRYIIKGDIFQNEQNYKSAIEAYINALNKSKQNDFAINESTLRLAKSYKSLGDFKNSSYYYDSYLSLNDSLFNQTFIQDMEKSTHLLEIKHFSDISKINFLKNKWMLKQIQVKKLELNNSKLSRNLILSISILLITFLIIYLNFRFKTFKLRQKNLISKYNIELINEHLKGQEDEKERIALELHDSVANDLMALTFTNDTTLKMNLNSIIEKIRGISHELTTPSLSDDSSISIMSEKLLFRYFKDPKYSIYFGWYPLNLQCKFQNEFHQKNLYRILQEIFINIIKHSQATVIEINFCLYEESLALTISDNGVGFDDTKININGIGLENIKKRIRHIQSTVSIDSSNKSGTTFLIEIPIRLLKKFEANQD